MSTKPGNTQNDQRSTAGPDTTDSLRDLRQISKSSAPFITNPEQYLNPSESWSAPFIVEWLQREIVSHPHDQSYQKRCATCLNAIVKKYHVFPSSFFFNNIERDGDYPSGGGGFADVYKGIANGDHNHPVCLKVLRVHTQSDEGRRKKMIDDFCREALIWTHLDHPNVLPLLGVNTELFRTDFCLVSPWMSNGDIITFLKKNPNHDRMRSIREIAAGLEYLHSRSPVIVHGDIRGANILVDDGFNCVLADFGLSREAVSSATTFDSSTGMKGSLRWMAPEAYQPSPSSDYIKEDRSPRDIYAYACTIVEILTGKPPFPDLFDGAVIANVLFNNARPSRPTEVWCPDSIWKLIERCWNQDSRKRPTARYIHSYLKGCVATIPDTIGDGPLDVDNASTRVLDDPELFDVANWCYPRARWKTKQTQTQITEANPFHSIPILGSVDFLFAPRFFI